MKVLVTGAKGMLGKYLTPLLEEKGYDVLATDHQSLDVVDYQAVMEIFKTFAPQMVIHLATMTNVDQCEREPEKAFLINTLGTENIAQHCRIYNCTMVYISTGMVYPGDKPTPYIEYDATGPINVYGKSKLMGELEVQRYVQDFYIFYATWLFGGKQVDKKFVVKMIELAKNRSEISVVNDKWGSPCYAKDHARAMLEIIGKKRFGKYHLVNEGFCNRAEFAREIFKYANIKCKVNEVSSAHFPLSAPRQYNEAIANFKLKLLGIKPMRGWQEALKEYIEEEILEK